jgi:hypothetical protein
LVGNANFGGSRETLGDADILWQSTDGPAAIWLINGTTPISQEMVGNNHGPSWPIHAAS